MKIYKNQHLSSFCSEVPFRCLEVPYCTSVICTYFSTDIEKTLQVLCKSIKASLFRQPCLEHPWLSESHNAFEARALSAALERDSLTVGVFPFGVCPAIVYVFSKSSN